METAAVVHALEALKAGNERYRDPRRLMVHGAQYWSQNYEDGMIGEVFRRIGLRSKTFLEIGVGDGRQNNTTALLAAGWKGWWIDGSPENTAVIRAKLAEDPYLRQVLAIDEALISPANANSILSRMGVPAEVDLFSLDIDLDTYHIWEALTEFRPRVVVVEYNAAFPPDLSWIHPFQPSQSPDGTQSFGASLKAFELLGRQRGYSLVGCEITGSNAFFVRDDEVGEHFASPFTAENHYEPVRYHLGYRIAHPAKLFVSNQARPLDQVHPS
jgi:hypothetical protein